MEENGFNLGYKKIIYLGVQVIYSIELRINKHLFEGGGVFKTHKVMGGI